eukprot:PITA_12814
MIFPVNNLSSSSCSVKDKEKKAVESSFEHDQDVLMPGFRFHPTEEELVEFYLRRKVEGKHFNIELIRSLDLYRYDPWELPAFASLGENEWYFYVQRDRKYRSGDRPNRVATSGYWKATGADRMIRNEVSHGIGLKKTLVFYKGKAPKGKRTCWIMNEYRLPQLENQRIQKNELSLCRVYKRPGGSDEERVRAKKRRIEIETISVSENHESSCSVPIPESASMRQCQAYIACNNPRTTAESCNLEMKASSKDGIVKLEELATDIKFMPKSVVGDQRFGAHMEYGLPNPLEDIQERIYSLGRNAWNTVSSPVSLNEDPELPFTNTCLMCPRAPDQLAMAEDLYSNNLSYLLLTNALTYGACLPTCSDKLWEWNPVRNNGDGPSC